MNFSKLLKKETDKVPEIVFEDLSILPVIGNWLGLIPLKFGLGDERFYTHLETNELLKEGKISIKDVKNIAKKFGTILRLAGFDNEERCILNRFDNESVSFNCHFTNTKTDVVISLKNGDMIETSPQFSINEGNVINTYDYIETNSAKKGFIVLREYVLKDLENGNSCFRFLSSHAASFVVKSGDYTFSLVIQTPEEQNDYHKIFRLDGEEELQQYLLSLTFPIEIDKVYNRLVNICGFSVHRYQNFTFKVEMKTGRLSSEITDYIRSVNGNLDIDSFRMTKYERIINIGDVYKVQNYDANKLNRQEFSDECDPQIKIINGAIEAKELILTMFHS